MLREALPEIVTGSVPGPKAAELLKRRDAAIPKAMCGTTYPICMGRGEGAMLEDVDGNRFLDWIGGVGVLNIGYSNPEVVEAVKAQADKYFHGIFNVYVHEGYVKLAEMFDETMPCRGDKMKTYFANSGAEADENAIKIAKAYTGRNNIICFSGAFHGRTNLTMALTAKKAYALGMGPFPAGIYRAEFPYLYRAPKGYAEEEAIDYYIEKFLKLFDEATPASDVAAVILEPLQGEGGFIPAPIEFVKRLRKICDDNGIMLIADEVQCGNCRTGKYFASEYWKEAGAAPDIIATAKIYGSRRSDQCDHRKSRSYGCGTGRNHRRNLLWQPVSLCGSHQNHGNHESRGLLWKIDAYRQSGHRSFRKDERKIFRNRGCPWTWRNDRCGICQRQRKQRTESGICKATDPVGITERSAS